MAALPLLAPQLCPLNGFDGTSARELWLNVMAAVNAAIGGSYLVRALGTGLVASLNQVLVQRAAKPAGVKAYAVSRNAVGSLGQ